ncbi:hypothetical protein PUN28_008524 [Cardiocondyla obscurior]|uniref:Uncharacterized protein n=1 Tax=Cardiocondyla obscurior TaxID=286306 RepID=A0AAW2FY40_9HYME
MRLAGKVFLKANIPRVVNVAARTAILHSLTLRALVPSPRRSRSLGHSRKVWLTTSHPPTAPFPPTPSPIYVSILEVRHMHNLTTTCIISYACVLVHTRFVKGLARKGGIESGLHVHAYIPA